MVEQTDFSFDKIAILILRKTSIVILFTLDKNLSKFFISIFSSVTLLTNPHVFLENFSKVLEDMWSFVSLWIWERVKVGFLIGDDSSTPNPHLSARISTRIDFFDESYAEAEMGFWFSWLVSQWTRLAIATCMTHSKYAFVIGRQALAGPRDARASEKTRRSERSERTSDILTKQF